MTRLVILLVVIFGVHVAHADEVWEWSGDCLLGCIGTAHMTVQVPDGHPSGFQADVPFPLLIGATYSDSTGSADLTSNRAFAVFIPSAVLTFGGSLTTGVADRWQFDSVPPFAGVCDHAVLFFECYIARGVKSQWTGPEAVTPVSEPPVWALAATALGLLGLGRLMRRRQ